MAKVQPIEGDLVKAHVKVLRDRAIRPKAIRARGYRSARSASEARRAGFGPGQARPGLIVPIWTVNGETPYNVLRPDEPRVDSKGNPRKYETPAGRQLVVDVPPSTRSKLDDAETPLWVTEAPLKADALVSAGLAAVAIIGVSGWSAKKQKRGDPRVLRRDWDAIALDGREVFLAFDSDYATNDQVRQELALFSEALAARGAKVRPIYLPPRSDGSKQGVDDFLASGHTLEDLVALVGELIDIGPERYFMTRGELDVPICQTTADM